MSLDGETSTSAKAPAPFKQVFLEKWAPAIIVALIGAIAVPWLQTTFAQRTELAKRRLQLWESLGENFTNYVNYRSRLNEAARTEMKLRAEGVAAGPEFRARKEGYREKRDEYSNMLRRDFLLANLYFGKKVELAIDEFLAWHEKYRTATVNELPPDQDYLSWRDSIMTSIRDELETLGD